MQKEIEIQGCIEIPSNISAEDFEEAFIAFIESHGWCFGGGFREIVDGYYINADVQKRK